MDNNTVLNRKKSAVPKPMDGHDGGASPLPCLNSNISIETQDQSLKIAQLSTQHRKSSFILKESVFKLSELHGINFLGFLTLTFSDHVLCPREAQRRLNSLISNVIKPRYTEYVGVMERQKSGRIHYHMLVVLKTDIRKGFNFDQASDGIYTSASKTLRSEWAFWRKTAKNYKFGRTELLPVRSSSEAIARYVGKYISKHIESRLPEDKGARLVRYSRGARAGTTRFQFKSEGSKQWRQKVAMFAQILNEKYPNETIKNLQDISRVAGPRWAYNNREFILSLPPLEQVESNKPFKNRGKT